MLLPLFQQKNVVSCYFMAPHEDITCCFLGLVLVTQALCTWASGMQLFSILGHPCSGNEMLPYICLWSWVEVLYPSSSSSRPMFGMFVGP